VVPFHSWSNLVVKSRRLSLRLFLVPCVLCVLCVEPIDAQILVGIEARRDRFTYHFDNPSSIDTPFLVPHFFEQRYVADNVWLTGSASYVALIRWETTAGITPQRTSTGDDYDTFFNPDGTVFVSGTTGGISIRSLRISQLGEIARRGAAALVSGYRLRLDRSDFHLGHKTVTRNGVLIEASDVTTRETTSSQLHELLFGLTAAFGLGNRWGVSVAAAVAPVALGRLLVRLPDKYPGQDLVFLATVGTATSRATLTRRFDNWALAFSLDGGGTWSYRSTAALSRRVVGARVAVTR
jgi:hypothetical protein